MSTIEPADDNSTCFVQINGSNTMKNNFNHSRGDDDDDDLSEEVDAHTPGKNDVRMIFILPYSFSRESILNQTVFITDRLNSRILPPFIDICMNESSFFISYSTNQSLPHNVCLYLLLNLTTTTSRELFLCRMINGKSSLSMNRMSSNDHNVGPGVIFILLQGVIIVIMMCMIAIGHRAREKHVVSRIRQYFSRTKSNDQATNITEFISPPIEQLVLAATDLTSTSEDRKYTNHTLIDIREFTKRLSGTSHDAELHHQF